MNILVAKTGFLISLISYGFFLLCEYLRPGFVSFVFFVHLFLIPIVIFGIWFALAYKENKQNVKISIIVQVLLGLLLMLILWREGEVFGDMRIFISFIGLFLPSIIIKSLKSN